MNPYSPDEYAASMSAALMMFDANRPRSQQPRLGVSSIGHCRSYALWVLNGVEATDAPEGLQALTGTAMHEIIGAARRQYNPKLLVDQKLEVTLPSGLVVPGTADEIDPDEPSVTDYKTVVGNADMVALRRNGSDEQQRFQRQLYYWGAVQAGLVPPEGIVRNVWIDRSGQSSEPYVEQEPFSMEWVNQADLWVNDVLYAKGADEEVPRDKHYDWCKRFCKFFTHCRSEVEHPDLIVSDTELLNAAENVWIGREMKKQGDGLDESGRMKLDVLKPEPGGDVQGYECGIFRVRWSWVNSGSARAGGYYKLAVERNDG